MVKEMRVKRLLSFWQRSKMNNIETNDINKAVENFHRFNLGFVKVSRSIKKIKKEQS